jgi:hypothetical protein
MAQGLADFFDIQTYAELKKQPLFAALYQKWEQERSAYLRSQLERVQSGQTELASYARKVEASLAGR